MKEKEEITAIVAKNLNYLMIKADLTIAGLAEGSNLTTHTIVKILNSSTKLSTKSAEKISNFFNISLSELLSSQKIKLAKISEIPLLNDFKVNNESNPTYFLSRTKENVVAYFLKNILILDSFMNVGRRVRDITTYIKKKYNKDFDPKVIAKELERMYKSNLIEREDPTGRKSVFYYKLKTPII